MEPKEIRQRKLEEEFFNNLKFVTSMSPIEAKVRETLAARTLGIQFSVVREKENGMVIGQVVATNSISLAYYSEEVEGMLASIRETRDLANK